MPSTRASFQCLAGSLLRSFPSAPGRVWYARCKSLISIAFAVGHTIARARLLRATGCCLRFLSRAFQNFEHPASHLSSLNRGCRWHCYAVWLWRVSVCRGRGQHFVHSRLLTAFAMHITAEHLSCSPRVDYATLKPLRQHGTGGTGPPTGRLRWSATLEEVSSRVRKVCPDSLSELTSITAAVFRYDGHVRCLIMGKAPAAPSGYSYHDEGVESRGRRGRAWEGHLAR